MICACLNYGLVLTANEDGAYLAACVCPQGQWWRQKSRLQARAAQVQRLPVWLEDAYTPAQLSTWGYQAVKVQVLDTAYVTAGQVGGKYRAT